MNSVFFSGRHMSIGLGDRTPCLSQAAAHMSSPELNPLLSIVIDATTSTLDENPAARLISAWSGTTIFYLRFVVIEAMPNVAAASSSSLVTHTVLRVTHAVEHSTASRTNT
jgi:hypothetical protein